MKLAEEVARTLDVDGMLSSITPQQFDEWIAFYLVEGRIRNKESLDQSLKTFRGIAGV